MWLCTVSNTTLKVILWEHSMKINSSCVFFFFFFIQKKKPFWNFHSSKDCFQYIIKLTYVYNNLVPFFTTTIIITMIKYWIAPIQMTLQTITANIIVCNNRLWHLCFYYVKHPILVQSVYNRDTFYALDKVKIYCW